MTQTQRPEERLRQALESADPSTRLQAAMTAGTHPDPAFIRELVARCAVEPDFSVRDTLTWALTRQDRGLTVAAVLPELQSANPQARSQGLHTLSKIGDPATWSAITRDHLRDPDPRVARTAWRTAAGLAPDGEREGLAAEFATQFGRGDRETQRSLARAFGMLGDAATAVVERATASDDPRVSAHAIATRAILRDPDAGFDGALDEARRTVMLRGAPRIEG